MDLRRGLRKETYSAGLAEAVVSGLDGRMKSMAAKRVWWRGTAVVAIALGLATQAWEARAGEPEALGRSLAAERSAVAALRAGDEAKAVAEIERAVAQRDDGSPAALQLAEGLMRVGAWLRNGSDYRRAAVAADLAVRRISLSRSSLGKEHQGRAAQLLGEIHERLLGDAASALECYREAAAASPAAPGAAEGVARMEARQAALKAKAEENELLRARAAAGEATATR